MDFYKTKYFLLAEYLFILYYQAEKYIKEALRIWYDLYPEGKYVMTVALENLYGIYSGKGDYVNANHVAQQLLDIRKRTYIENHPLIASSHLYLAYSYGLMNNEMKEEEHLNQAVSMLDQLENAKNQDFIRLYSDIATIRRSHIVKKSERVLSARDNNYR